MLYRELNESPDIRTVNKSVQTKCDRVSIYYGKNEKNVMSLGDF